MTSSFLQWWDQRNGPTATLEGVALESLESVSITDYDRCLHASVAQVIAFHCHGTALCSVWELKMLILYTRGWTGASIYGKVFVNLKA